MAVFNGLGTVGRDGELRTTPNGTPVINVALAFNYGQKGQDGRKPTQWVDASLWGKQAEALAPYITKGRQFFVSIKDLHIETYQANSGPGAKLVGVIADIEFARDGSGGQNSNQAPQQQQRSAPAPQRQQQSRQQDNSFDDDQIPF